MLPLSPNSFTLMGMRKEINTDWLKLIALMAMTLDHIAYNGLLPLWVQYSVGRLAFPIFACLLTYHLQTKQLFAKYTERLLFWGMITLFVRPDSPELNIFFTFLWPVLTIWGLKKLNTMQLSRTLYNILLELLFVAGAFCSMTTSYEIYGFIYVCLWYCWWGHPHPVCGVFLIAFGVLANWGAMSVLCCTSAALATAALLFVLPGGRRWLKHSYLFYPYYPLHFWVISCLAKHTFIIPCIPPFMWVWGGLYFVSYGLIKTYIKTIKKLDKKNNCDKMAPSFHKKGGKQ